MKLLLFPEQVLALQEMADCPNFKLVIVGDGGTGASSFLSIFFPSFPIVSSAMATRLVVAIRPCM